MPVGGSAEGGGREDRVSFYSLIPCGALSSGGLLLSFLANF